MLIGSIVMSHLITFIVMVLILTALILYVLYKISDIGGLSIGFTILIIFLYILCVGMLYFICFTRVDTHERGEHQIRELQQTIIKLRTDHDELVQQKADLTQLTKSNQKIVEKESQLQILINKYESDGNDNSIVVIPMPITK